MREFFRDQAWPGVYFEVITEGEAKAGDELVLKKRIQSAISVMDVFLSVRAAELKLPKNETIERILGADFILDRYTQRLRSVYA